MIEKLQNWSGSQVENALLYSSRIQRLPVFESVKQRVFVKREDESGFGISGCKKRKYASLLPFLEQGGFDLIGLIGSERSNHVVGLLQLLRERGLGVRLYLKKGANSRSGGNRTLLNLLANEEECRWISSEQWPEVGAIAQADLQQRGGHNYLVPEGGSCAPALPGACSLMLDILRNEQENDLQFDHICIDAGTGLMAAALTLSHHWLERAGQIHVIQMAGKDGEFAAMLHQTSEWAHQLGFPASSAPLPELYRPSTARSFGSVNARVREEVRFLARNCGLLAEPVYVAKLFLSFREDSRFQALEGNILLIHSGGGTGLMGWEW